jgi:uncharacterized protein (DUF1778 family)
MVSFCHHEMVQPPCTVPKFFYLGQRPAPMKEGRSMANTKLQDATSVSRGRIAARVPIGVQELVQQAADMVGSTFNQFVTQAVLEAAEKVIERERIIRLSGENAKWFFDLLDNPPPPSLALRDAFKRYNARKVVDEGSASTFEFGDS